MINDRQFIVILGGVGMEKDGERGIEEKSD